MKKFLFPILTVLALAALPLTSNGQSRTDDYIRRLSTSGGMTGTARATVTNEPDVVQWVSGSPATDKVKGYRVRIFFDNSQNARSMADGALSRFRALFPGIPGEVIYRSPNFMVNVGYCMNQIEATILQGKVRGAFPKAFWVPQGEVFPIANLIQNLNIPQENEEAETQPADENAVLP